MYSHINYEYARQYHADLLRKAEQIRLVRQVKPSKNQIFDRILTLAASAIAMGHANLARLSPDPARARICNPVCESC